MGQVMTGITLRYMCRRDLPAVMTIENSCFDEAWPLDEFESLLKQKTCSGVIADCNGDAVGFLVYETVENRIEVLNFAVRPDRQREGIGSRLIEKLFSQLSERRPDIVIDVRETNKDAQLFLKFCDFTCTSILKEHFDNGESAYRFRYNLFGMDE